MALPAGTSLGPYAIGAHLATGGMAEVYAARDERDGRRVAIKVLPRGLAASPLMRARFEGEVLALSRIDRPGVCRLIQAGESEGTRYLALEFLDGETLAARLTRGPIPPAASMEIARRLAATLTGVHAAGFVHGDLKPANVMISPGGRVTLFDFGLARALLPEGTGASEGPEPVAIATRSSEIVLGTPACMSPEAARRERLDARSDVWGVGLVLFEALAGRPAFAGDSARAILDAVVAAEPPWDALSARVPEPVTAFIRRALEKDPAHRWGSAAAAGAALAALASARQATDAEVGQKEGRNPTRGGNG